MRFQSTKLIDGFSTCFRQEKAYPSHCSSLHGYALSFKVTFEGPLDYRNWVVDFGFLKTCKTVAGTTVGEWFKEMFDHTCLVSVHDSQIEWFKEAHERGIMKVWFLPGGVGCEKFAELVFSALQACISAETSNRVKVVSVECIENQKNSAIVYDEIPD